MPKARNLIDNASFAPEALKILGEVFDAVWASVAPDFGDDRQEIETARIRLATIVLELAKDGQLGPHQIARTARRLIRAVAARGGLERRSS